MISLRSIIDLTTVFLSSTLSLDELVTGLVIICVWIAPICPTQVGAINLQTQNSPDLTPKSLSLLVTKRRGDRERQTGGAAAAVTKPPHPSIHIISPDKKSHGYKFVTTPSFP